MMKKFILLPLLFLCLGLSATAQELRNRIRYEAYTDKDYQQYVTHYLVDRKAMEFHFDWDSDNEMMIKNYKRNGNTETFDAFMPSEPGKRYAHIVLTIDPANQEYGQITISVNNEYEKRTDNYFLKEHKDERGQGYSGKADAPTNPKDAVKGGAKGTIKDGAKNLLNKGKDLFKKKK